MSDRYVLAENGELTLTARRGTSVTSKLHKTYMK